MLAKQQSIAILGSTGSVGQSTLDVVSLHPDLYSIYALTANENIEQMLLQCQQFQPKLVVMADQNAATTLAKLLRAAGLEYIEVQAGDAAIVEVAKNDAVDTVMSAVVGAAGLLPTLTAVQAAKRVLIANKEPLVMTGDLFMSEARQSGAVILPIDSEHNAIFQCLPETQSQEGVKRIHLTASGGPFRNKAWSDLCDITPDQACAHPNWSMGRKISVDSATMMNKGLELIEAAALFDIPPSNVDIVIHPQSIIHSMVEYCDGSFLAQLGAPDMRIPIAHALSWPNRISSGAKSLDISEIAQLDFHKPDMVNLPCLQLARQAAELGGTMPAALNAANEVAVAAFLSEELRFTDIPLIIEAVLEKTEHIDLDSIDHVLQIDNEARRRANAALNSIART